MLSPMRRRERAVSDWNHVLEIIQSCDCCRVAFSEPDGPYIVPMNFGIESSQEGQMVLYFHGASAGKKGELMQKNPCVGFEMDTGHGLVPGAQAYSCSFLYQRDEVLAGAGFVLEALLCLKYMAFKSGAASRER